MNPNSPVLPAMPPAPHSPLPQGLPPSSPKKGLLGLSLTPKIKKRIMVIGIVSCLLIIGLVVVLFVLQQSTNKSSAPSTTQADPASQYAYGIDSPIGLIPEVASSQSGTYSLVINGSTRTVPLNGTYYIEPSGEVWFDALPHSDKTNDLLDYLASKSGTSTEEEVGNRKVSRFASFDFADITGGKELLYDYPSVFSGLIPAVEQEITTSTPSANQSDYKIITDQNCQTKTVAARTALSNTRLNTRVLTFSKNSFIDETTYDLPATSLVEKNTAIKNFIAACFASTTPGTVSPQYTALQAYYEAMKDSSYSFSYTAKDEGFELVITKDKAEYATITLVPAQNSERPEGTRQSLLQRNMLFGAVHNACRGVPVVASQTSQKMVFLAEDTAYSLPSENDEIYTCTTSNFPEGTIKRNDLLVMTDKGNVSIPASSVEYGYSELLHDVAIALEKVYSVTGTYPAITDKELIEELGTAAQQEALAAVTSSNKLTYSRFPSDCQKDCKEFEINFVLFDTLTFKKRNFESTVR